MKPFKETMVAFDTGLAKLATSMLRLTAGKNGDGTEKTAKDRAQEVGSAGFPEGLAIDPSVMGSPAPADGKKVKDPVDRFYRWLFNQPDYSEGPANKVEALQMNTLGMQFPKLNLSKLAIEQPNLADGEYRQFRLPPTYTAADIMEASAQQQRKQTALLSDWMSPDDPNNGRIVQPAESKIDQSHTEVNVSVNVDARGMDATEVKQLSAETFHDEFNKVLRTVRADQTEIE